MKVVLVSGFLNKHMLPICLELKKCCEFYFIATQDTKKVHEQFKDILKYDFVIDYFIKENKELVKNLVIESDIAIFGGSSLELLELRKETNKLSYIYTERLFKRGQWRRFIPTTKKVNDRKFKGNCDNVYVLCAGSYVVSDLKLLGFNTEHCFKFGYFPEIELRDVSTIIERKSNDTFRMLYAGRLLKLKRIKDILKCAKILQEKGIDYELNIVGDGPEKGKLENCAKRMKLQQVHFLGSKSREELFEIMEVSNALYFSSNYYEGWGAVVNESLASACPVIGSNACGSIAYLIKEAKNGYSYCVGNVRDMYNKTMLLMQACTKRSFYDEAQSTIKNEWNAQIAVERLIRISQNLIDEVSYEKYESGPMSQA